MQFETIQRYNPNLTKWLLNVGNKEELTYIVLCPCLFKVVLWKLVQSCSLLTKKRMKFVLPIVYHCTEWNGWEHMQSVAKFQQTSWLLQKCVMIGICELSARSSHHQAWRGDKLVKWHVWIDLYREEKKIQIIRY